MSDTIPHYVAVALTRGASIIVREVDLTPGQAAGIADLCSWLVRQGHVACFTIQPASAVLGRDGMIDALRGCVGEIVVDADLAAGPPPVEPAAGYLMPVWPFDHELGGMPASTGQFLGLDLELIATPSPDEEVGFHLSDRDGLWLLHARPL